jgi:hypothetical protein
LACSPGGWLWWLGQDSRCRGGSYDNDADCFDGDINPGAIVGVALGLATAVIVDSAVIARPVKVRKPKAAALTPRLSVTPDRIALGFATRF